MWMFLNIPLSFSPCISSAEKQQFYYILQIRAFICLFGTSIMCYDNQPWALRNATWLKWGEKNYEEKKSLPWTKFWNIYSDSDQQS